MVPLLSSLEARGLLVRHAHPSGGRAMPARLTTQGIALLKTGWKAVQTVEEQMLHGLAAKEQARLREVLEHCLAALRAEDQRRKKVLR
jgi:DNA-binding MarR family transcriptional regulator